MSANGTHENGVLMPRKNKTITLGRAGELTPPPAEGVGAFAEAALAAAFDGITGHDMADMMKGIMQKAKEGDMKAAKFVLDFLGGHKAPPPQVTFHVHKTKRTSSSRQTHEREGRPRADDDDVETPMPRAVPPAPHVVVLRRFAARVISADGPSPLPGLAGQLGLTEPEVRHVLDCDWFAVADGKASLTPAGRQGAGS